MFVGFVDPMDVVQSIPKMSKLLSKCQIIVKSQRWIGKVIAEIKASDKPTGSVQLEIATRSSAKEPSSVG
jgi:hypothetical protein